MSALRRMLPLPDEFDDDLLRRHLLAAPAEVCGFALRLPSRLGGDAIARWAALQTSLSEAKQLDMQLGMALNWDAADLRLRHAIDDPAELGLDLSSGVSTPAYCRRPDHLAAVRAGTPHLPFRCTEGSRKISRPASIARTCWQAAGAPPPCRPVAQCLR